MSSTAFSISGDLPRSLGISSNSTVSALAGLFSSVMISLSKGLGAPVGSILAGPADFIEQARTVRKQFGGGWRQAGILAAAARVALQESPPLLARDHQRARSLAEAAARAGFRISPEQVETNIVIFEDEEPRAEAHVQMLAQKGILCLSTSPTSVRMVTHRDLTDEDIQRAVVALAGLPEPA